MSQNTTTSSATGAAAVATPVSVSVTGGEGAGGEIRKTVTRMIRARTAQAAGAVTLEYFNKGTPHELKADNSPVTEADRRAELLLRERIEGAFPAHGILGEEFGEKPGGEGAPGFGPAAGVSQVPPEVFLLWVVFLVVPVARVRLAQPGQRVLDAALELEHAEPAAQLDVGLWCKALVLFKGLGGVEPGRVPAFDLDVVLLGLADKIVAAVKWVDGSVIDCVRQVAP